CDWHRYRHRRGGLGCGCGIEAGRGDRWQLDGEGAPLPFAGADGGQAAAMRPRQRTADGQPQPQTVRPAAGGVSTLLEGLEDAWQDLGLDADTRVADLDDQPVAVDTGAGVSVGSLRVAGADADHAAGRRELHGVLDQVPDNLLEPCRVGMDVV